MINQVMKVSAICRIGVALMVMAPSVVLGAIGLADDVIRCEHSDQ
jgi:hypothetical protein